MSSGGVCWREVPWLRKQSARSGFLVTGSTPIQGELQAQVMAALWRLGSGTVDQVRDALPARYRSAYTTVQTVLNRLAERGLLDRERR